MVVVATDLPGLDTSTLRWLVARPGGATVVPVVAGRPQPLCARWAVGDLLLAGELAAAGETSLRALLDAADVVLADPGERGGPGTAPFLDVDTPADARRFALAPASSRPGEPAEEGRPPERADARPRAVTPVRAIGVRPGRHLDIPERVATEEPLEVRAAGPGQEPEAVAVTMRTPGHDFELAAGFLVTEGLAVPSEIATVAYCAAAGGAAEGPAGAGPDRFNVVSVSLTRRWAPAAARRQFLSTSSCGICGKASIDEVALACPVVTPGPPVPATVLASLPDRMRERQAVFDRTGGLHAAALFTADGELLALREDVGRHNAVDKIVGHRVLSRQPAPPGAVLAVSGRVSFEITQKAAMAGVGVIAAVSAPSSLAVSAAERLGVAVAGFVRGGTFNLYSHPERVDLDV